MRATVPVLVITGLFLAGCNSRANPVNWFDSDHPDESVLAPIESTNPLIPESTGIFDSRKKEDVFLGTPIDAIADLTLERVPGGILIRATGRSATQGAYNARLTPANEDEIPEEGVLSYRLEAQYTQITGGSAETREVTVARKLTDQELEGTRTIRVEGVQNALERRR